MKFALYDHAGKGLYLRQKLELAGHKPVENLADADVFVLDCDWRWARPRPDMIAAAAAAGVTVVLYPHGGQPTVFVYDGLTDPDPNVSFRLEHGPGSVTLADKFGADDLDQCPVGWLYSTTASFSPVERPRRVLFAPMHPNIEMAQRASNGHDPAPALNQCVYRDLLAIDCQLTVSVVGPAYMTGIWPHPRAKIVQNDAMQFPQSYQLLQDADVVVADGTIAAAAVAAGKPLVAISQPDFADYIDGTYQACDHPELAELARYPISVTDGHIGDLIQEACAGTEATAEWRKEYVGDDGTDAAIALLEQLTKGTPYVPPAEVMVEGVTAKVTTRSKEG